MWGGVGRGKGCLCGAEGRLQGLGMLVARRWSGKNVSGRWAMAQGYPRLGPFGVTK